MTAEAIVKHVETGTQAEKALQIHFKEREAIIGLFIKGNDYEEFRSKNFWRVVTHTKMEEWKKTRDLSLSRIFNGAAFSRLSPVS